MWSLKKSFHLIITTKLGVKLPMQKKKNRKCKRNNFKLTIAQHRLILKVLIVVVFFFTSFLRFIDFMRMLFRHRVFHFSHRYENVMSSQSEWTPFGVHVLCWWLMFPCKGQQKMNKNGKSGINGKREIFKWPNNNKYKVRS